MQVLLIFYINIGISILYKKKINKILKNFEFNWFLFIYQIHYNLRQKVKLRTTLLIFTFHNLKLFKFGH